MDVVEIARLQFAITAGLHFLFVLLTLGLAPTVAIYETRFAITGNPVAERITRFLGQIYLINYALGILTGLVMEFQLGFAWKGLSSFYGNVIGAPIALETMLAFFLESTFLGLWIFGWHRMNRWVHCALIWLVSFTAYMSAFWIMVANTWMQSPVGYEVRDGVGYLTDFDAIMRRSNLGFAVAHTVSAAALTVGFLLIGIGAWHFLRHRRLRMALARKRRKAAGKEIVETTSVFLSCMRFGVLLTSVGGFTALAIGFARLGPMKTDQPFKYALFSGANEENIAQAQRDAQEKFGPGDYTPPEWASTASSFMEGMGFLFLLLALLLPVLLLFNLIARFRPVLILLLLLPPLPFATAIAGWIYREVGRQPWVIYGELMVDEALSPVAPGLLLGSLIIFTTLFVTLAVTNWWLILRTIRRGPDAVVLGAQHTEPTDVAPGRIPTDLIADQPRQE